MNQSETTSAAGGGEPGLDHYTSLAWIDRKADAAETVLDQLVLQSLRHLVSREILDAAAPTAKGGAEVRWEDVSEGVVVQVIAAYREARRKYGATSEEASVARGCLYDLEVLCRSIAASPPPPAGAGSGGSGEFGALSAGEDAIDRLTELNKAATQGAWYVVDTPWGNGDWISAGNPDPHAGKAVCNFDFLDEDREDDGPTPQDDAAFVAALVTVYRSGLLTRASFAEHYLERTLDLAKEVRELKAASAQVSAPTPDLGAQGEPVAWADLIAMLKNKIKEAEWHEFGRLQLSDFIVEQKDRLVGALEGTASPSAYAYDVNGPLGWQAAASPHKPSEACHRNIRPLYEAPITPRTGSGVSVEEIARQVFIANNVAHDGTPQSAAEDWSAGIFPRDRDMAFKAADAILALFAQAPRDGGETLETIAEWCEQTFGPIQPERIVSRAAEEMDELRAEPTKVEEAADVVIVLARYPGLWAEIQRKMKINRARKWRLMGDGTGYHIKPTPPSGVETSRQDNTSGGK